jgi:hypothetical protein
VTFPAECLVYEDKRKALCRWPLALEGLRSAFSLGLPLGLARSLLEAIFGLQGGNI